MTPRTPGTLVALVLIYGAGAGTALGIAIAGAPGLALGAAMGAGLGVVAGAGLELWLTSAGRPAGASWSHPGKEPPR